MTARTALRVTATLAAIALPAGCDDDGGGEPAVDEPVKVSPTLALASDLSDLYTRAIAGLEGLAAAEDDAARAKASGPLEDVSREADRLAGEAQTMEGPEGREIARDAGCLSATLSRFRSAAGGPLGEEAQAEAEAAGDKLRACLGSLEMLLAGLSPESASSSQALVARTRAVGKDLNSVLPDLVASLAAVEPPAETTTEATDQAADLPPCRGPTFPCLDTNGTVLQGEADVPPCNAAAVVIPCRDPTTGAVIYGD